MSLRCYRKSDDRSLFLFLLSRFPNSVSFLRSAPSKNVRSDHSHNGRQPRAIRGSLPEAPWIGCPSVPRSHGEVAGAVSFLGLCRATSGPYDFYNKRIRFLSEGCASHWEKKAVEKQQYSVPSTRYSERCMEGTALQAVAGAEEHEVLRLREVIRPRSAQDDRVSDIAILFGGFTWY